MLAKEKLGENAAIFINEKMELENWDEKNLKASCPLQSTTDNTPSFIWNSKDNCFHCFSCWCYKTMPFCNSKLVFVGLGGL